MRNQDNAIRNNRNSLQIIFWNEKGHQPARDGEEEFASQENLDIMRINETNLIFFNEKYPNQNSK